uniref:alcohol dehydrogenase catalytic domain-containing protein n=1 Tax=Rhizobium rhizogenes TaxID=359 RepID=UPI00155DA8D8|nr:alcohol dehydrogenase catalytic domain-containing protein [Rhizobium rhizogenes]
MHRYILTGNETRRLKLTQGDVRQPEKGEVAVDVRSASLNYRDLVIARNFKDVVPLSDGAGVVAAVGEGVEDWKVGDRVVIGFMPGWVEGPITPAKKATSLGGQTMDGVLTERIVVPSNSIVRIPDARAHSRCHDVRGGRDLTMRRGDRIFGPVRASALAAR